MSSANYPPSPPASTSLPEHWQFVPPPTDGPNTRARQAQGLRPYSGTAAPLPDEVVVRGPSDRSGTGGLEGWNAWNVAADEQQYWYAAGPSTGLPATYFAIDPSLDFDPTTLPSLPFSHVGSPRLPDPPAEFYDSNREDRRLFSSATIVDHGSPPASPEPSVLADSAGSTVESQLQAPTVGVSREEWLRLGGFSDDPGLPSLPPPPPPPRSAPVQLPSTPAKRRAEGLRKPFNAAPHAPVHPLPPPVASAPPAMQYPLPAAPHLPPPVPSVLAPVKLEEDDSPLATAGQLPARSKRRRAPSPLNPTRLRPSPYPTSSSSAISSPRILTPVSHALAHYADHPVPEHPPPQADPDAPKKKKHGRKFSVGHVPRPRNAFILFRSHAVTSGLIPRSVGINDHKNISKVVGSVWRGLSAPERRKWDELAEEEKRLHKERYPDYVFRPKQKGQRAAVGEGKKAKAKAARLAAERDREGAPAGSVEVGTGTSGEGEGDGDDEGDDYDPDDAFDEPRRPRRRSVAARTSPAKRDEAREQRRMELIGQAVLEGEDDDRIVERVEAELAAEDKAFGRSGDIRVDSPAASPDKSTARRSPNRAASSSPSKTASPARVVTPRKGRSSIQQRLKQESSPTSPDIVVRTSNWNAPGLPSPSASSESTLSPSPYRHQRMVSGPVAARVPVSPASSPSPSPQRMQQAARSRGTGSAGQSRHPLSRSQRAGDDDPAEHDLPAARRSKASSYAAAGLGVTAAPPAEPYSFPPVSNAPLNVPLFAGPADSRQFSLGKWELRKPSTAVSSRREALALHEEESAAATSTDPSGWFDPNAAVAPCETAPLSLDPHEFLIEAGLDGSDALTDYGTVASSSSLWDYPTSSYHGYDGASETASSSCYESARSGGGFGPGQRMPPGLFRAPSSSSAAFSAAAETCPGIAAGPEPGDLFHFGEVDLFAQPVAPVLPALASSSSSMRTVSSIFGPPPSVRSAVQSVHEVNEMGAQDEAAVGLGISFGG
ncbi:HMG-box domain-containing protein [Rhodotorula paludigena]|uniref:HMG-box domain-containing protein n=1 Tax=Rhodotorula paludigena TaxID=86838 RepID=UPI0031729ABA